MQGSTIQIQENDRVLILDLNKPAVPTNHEVKLLLDEFPDYSTQSTTLGFLIAQMMRPVEVPTLRWPWFKIGQSGKPERMTHTVYKPSNRRAKLGNNYYFKKVEKPIWSPWLSEQLRGYAATSPSYPNQRLYPFEQSDSIDDIFKKIRKKAKAGKANPCFLDTYLETALGPKITRYRLSPYSLRRFSITFHYWVTFNQDIIALSKQIGHSRPETTLRHYVQPKEAIGLTQEMIDQHINIDQFVHLRGKKQTQIIEFTPEWKKRFLPVGQRSLHEF